MPSPFPGMNPFLENDSVWQDFHQAYCLTMREWLVPKLAPYYYAKVNEHLYVHVANGDARRFLGRADVGVTSPGVSAAELPSVAVLEAPVEASVPSTQDIERSAYIEIRNKDDHDLVTVIELLGPTNKKLGDDRDQFLAKRRQIMASPVNYVEIDLLRGGPRLPIDDLPDCDYCIMVSRPQRRPRVGVWPLKLRDRLPEISIPVLQTHDEPRIDLQLLLHRVYEAAGYEGYIYRWVPQPRLHPQDAEWARQFVPIKQP